MEDVLRVFLRPLPVKAKDAISNPVVMSVLLSVSLSVCNKPRPLTSQAIISLGQADAKHPGDQHLVDIIQPLQDQNQF